MIHYCNVTVLKNIREVEIIQNKEWAHTELNLRQYLIDRDTYYNQYIGVSKLSCRICDIVLCLDELAHAKYCHAGTHGIVYPIEAIPKTEKNHSQLTDDDRAMDKTHQLLDKLLQMQCDARDFLNNPDGWDGDRNISDDLQYGTKSPEMFEYFEKVGEDDMNPYMCDYYGCHDGDHDHHAIMKVPLEYE